MPALRGLGDLSSLNPEASSLEMSLLGGTKPLGEFQRGLRQVRGPEAIWINDLKKAG